MNSLLLQGSVSATADTWVSLGTLTLPAGDKYDIAFVYASFVCNTFVNPVIPSLRLTALSGDVSPNPAPFSIPLPAVVAAQAAPAVVATVPPKLIKTSYSAAGKSIIEIWVKNSGDTVTLYYTAGIIITTKDLKPAPDLRFVDVLQGPITAATTETTIGTFTLSEKSKRLVGVAAMILPDAAFAASKAMIGHIRLSSNDVSLVPLYCPISACVYGSSAAPSVPVSVEPFWIPLDIDVPNGGRIDVTAYMQLAQTATCIVWLAYE